MRITTVPHKTQKTKNLSLGAQLVVLRSVSRIHGLQELIVSLQLTTYMNRGVINSAIF